MLKVFISHSQKDSEISRKLTEYLTREGMDVWVDATRISGGDTLPEAIGEGINWCDAFVLIWSKSSTNSYYVKLEWNVAINLKKRIIPCIIDSSELPPILSAYIHLDFNNFERGCLNLAYALKLKKEVRRKAKKEVKIRSVEKEDYLFWKLLNNRVAIVYPYYCKNSETIFQSHFLVTEQINSLLKEINHNPIMMNHWQEVPQHADVVLICGPKANNLSKDFSEKIFLPFQLKTEDYKTYYFKDQKGNQYKSPSDIKSAKKVDLALVGRYTENNRRIFLFWGIHCPGTLGATKFIQNKKNLNEIWDIAKEKDFAVLVEVSYSGLQDIDKVTRHSPVEIM